MSSASGIVPDSTAAETFWMVSFWLIITTSVSTLLSSPQCVDRVDQEVVGVVREDQTAPVGELWFAFLQNAGAALAEQHGIEPGNSCSRRHGAPPAAAPPGIASGNSRVPCHL